jgi:acyl-CoA reductase-like NAD-dependent aldehyde dehydrogenase
MCARSGHDRDAGDLPAHDLAFVRMDPGTNTEIVCRRPLDDSMRAGDRSRRPVEAAEEPVAGRIELFAAIAGELAADVRVMPRQDIAPCASPSAKPHDVHGGKVSHYTQPVATTATERRILIGGEWVKTDSWLEVFSPYDGSLVGRVAEGGAAETTGAIDAAERAMADPLPAHERAAILDRTARLVEERAEEVARTITAEAGKPMKAARIEASRAVSTFTMAAVEARKLAGDVVPMDASPAGAGKLAFTLRTPIGVVGAISPFNFPFNLVAHKVAPALAAGCAVVLKPASQTPLSALLLAELETEAGLPPGWLNVVCGPASEIGDVLVEDERVALITFTGSAGVGWKLRERAPRKRVNLELGNATPVIVAADSDLDDTATRLAAHAFSFAGQSCISVQRIYVERTAYDDFLERFLPRVESLVVGDPADDATDVGPLISPSERERVLSWIEEATSRGATVLAGGTLDGDLLRPTVVADVPSDAKIACEEVFGPLCTLTPYDSLDEAIRLANGTRYGLQAGIFTRDVAVALRAARELEFGGVTVNEAPTFRADQMPYGGVKDSGNTREGPAYAVGEMTEERLVVLQL